MKRRQQQGIAAIEFCGVVLIFMALFYGVVTFGAAFYTQQVVSRAASEGARAASMMPNLGTSTTGVQQVQNVIYQSLASSLIAPNATPAARLAWVKATLAPPAVELGSTTQVNVRVVFPYRAYPMLPPIPLTAQWLPTTLVGHATASRLPGN